MPEVAEVADLLIIFFLAWRGAHISDQAPTFVWTVKAGFVSSTRPRQPSLPPGQGSKPMAHKNSRTSSDALSGAPCLPASDFRNANIHDLLPDDGILTGFDRDFCAAMTPNPPGHSPRVTRKVSKAYGQFFRPCFRCVWG